jgi:Holliday junction resolvasome RuvABC endonuclease subunit
MRIIGLDISTTCIGIAILDTNKDKIKLVNAKIYKPIEPFNKKVKELSNNEFLEMLDLAKIEIKQILDEYKPDQICIEDYIRFLKGGSGSSTIIPLAILNRTISLLCYDYCKTNNCKVSIYNVISIRTIIKKAAELSELPKKEELPYYLAPLMNITFPEYKNKKNNILPETYDVADAIAICFYHWRASELGLIKQ